METTAAFRDFYAPRNCFYGMTGVILKSDTAHSSITASCGKEQGGFGEDELLLLRVDAHLQRHLRERVLHSAYPLRVFCTAYLDCYPHGFLLTDDERRVLHVNASGPEIL